MEAAHSLGCVLYSVGGLTPPYTDLITERISNMKITSKQADYLWEAVEWAIGDGMRIPDKEEAQVIQQLKEIACACSECKKETERKSNNNNKQKG